MDRLEDLSAELQRLLDRAAIGDLLHEFAARLDGGEWDKYAATFTSDGIFELPWSRRFGREEIAAAAEADLAKFAAVIHYSTNHVLEIEGDTARARSYLIGIHVLDAADPATHADAGGWYDCELRRTAEGWRFTHVRVTIAWRGQLALPFAPPPRDSRP
ncbi:MAG: nuclear transport factor 2 family protein [Verrucomicrobiota bacterium]